MKVPLSRSLLSWYGQNRRPLPWRRAPTPYRVWISEIMLQQTTVRVVIPYYQRFLARFPDIPSLARARESEVLRAWAGLGYYSRARNLHQAARKIMSGHGGVFPGSYEQILALPGIGRYTAGAILSIAFGKPYPVVDGNVMRVFSRLYGIASPLKRGQTAKRMWALAEGLLPRKNSGDWNQALMELGATVCLPETPDCGACPVSKYCVAFKKRSQDRLPVVGARAKLLELRWKCLWIEKKNKVLLWKRSARERFLKGHWGLPEARHLKARPILKLAEIKHAITHHKITVEVWRGKLRAPAPPPAQWVPRGRVKDYLISSLWLKCVGGYPHHFTVKQCGL